MAKVSTFFIYRDISDDDETIGEADDQPDLFTAMIEYNEAWRDVKDGTLKNARIVAALSNGKEITLNETGEFR